MPSFSIPFPNSPISGEGGYISREWYLFIQGIFQSVGGSAVVSGGSGLSVTDLQTQLLLRINSIEGLVDAGRPLPLPALPEQAVAPTLLNSWVNFGAPFNSVGYYKDPFGIVHLRGMLKSGVAGSTMFNLPVGYRPQAQEVFPSISGNTIGRVDVATFGDVIMTFGASSFISLDGMTFKAYQ